MVISGHGFKRAKYLECPCCTVSFAIFLYLITLHSERFANPIRYQHHKDIYARSHVGILAAQAIVQTIHP